MESSDLYSSDSVSRVSDWTDPGIRVDSITGCGIIKPESSNPRLATNVPRIVPLRTGPGAPGKPDEPGDSGDPGEPGAPGPAVKTVSDAFAPGPSTGPEDEWWRPCTDR